MKFILKKLRSRAGASMILAMVFMLFCSFIGGTVLASATANAQRVAQMAEQQDFLLERSAALLVSDQLQLDDGDYLRLNVIDSLQTIEEMEKINDGGAFEGNGVKETTRVITFQVVSNVQAASMTSMHRLMLESTVWRYLREYAPDESPSVVCANFPGGATSTSGFLFIPQASGNTIAGNLNVSAAVTAPVGGTAVTIPDYTASFSSGRGINLYDFFVDFGADTQVKMTLNGFSGTGEPYTVVSPTKDDTNSNTGFSQLTTVSTQTIISWEDPLIEKGGAA